ncbi:MAG: tetratricopeptide repeat protein [Myxococcales bacterium]
MRRSGLMWVCLVGALWLGVPSLLAAQDAAKPNTAATDEEARVHFRLGTAYYDSGRFAQAAQEFQQAYDLSKRPQLLYNLFLAYRDAGDIRNAASALRQYLADNPQVEERSKLEARLAALEKIIEGQPAPQAQPQTAPTAATGQPATGPVATAEPTASTPAEPAPEAPPEDKLKWLPWTLMGAGGALVVAGVITGAMAKGDESDLEKTCPNDVCPVDQMTKADDLKSSGAMKATLSDALWISGAVSAGVGVAFLFWKPWLKRKETPTNPVNVACSSTGCAASYTGRF